MDRIVKQRIQDSSDDDEVVILQMQPTAKLKTYSSSDEEEDGTEMHIDGAFRRAGSFGWYQIRFFIFLLAYHIPAPFHIMAITFVGLSPKWSCSDDLEATIVTNHSGIDECTLYSDPTSNCTPVYTDRFYSIAQEWGLICDDSFKISISQSGLFLGFLIGSYVMGTLADRFGRRKVVIAAMIGLTLVQVMIALSPHFYVFVFGRFLIGFFVTGGMTAFVLLCELTGSSQRSLLASSQGAVFGLGYGVMALFAYLLRNWRWFTAATAIMSTVFVILSKYVPESPRWLLVNGREVEARQAMVDIARTNRRTMPAGFSLTVPQKESKSVKLIALFKHRTMRKRMIILASLWFTVCMVYYGLSLGVGNLSSNLYLAFTLSGLVEIPSNVFALFAMEKIGRKWSNVGLLFVGGVSGLACAIVQYSGIDSSGYVQLSLSLIGKFSVAASFSVIYTYTPELLPTDLRNSGFGIANVFARIGGILAPLIILLDASTHMPGLSMLIMGGLGTVVSILCLYLPETFKDSLPNTLEDIKK